MYHSIDKVDAYLDSKLPEFGYAVDVGANNGTFYSNSLHFEEKGWIVMCIEPNPLLERELRSTRKLCRSCACGEQNGIMEFVCIGNPPYPSGSGFHASLAREMFNLPKEEQRFTVEVVTLNDVLKGSGFPRLDFITIDVEGHELSVLKGIDLDKWRPKFIVCESWSSEPDYDSLLKQNGYHQIVKLGFDHVYERD